ncbi:MAG: dhkJ [Myxococcaceae bacterium]|nr:dhkJ [Myxococcaceae bacterium]
MEAAYRVLAEQALELVARHALDSTFRYASHGSSLLGRHPEELLGTRALELIDPEDREHARVTLDALISGARPRVSFSARFRRSDGSSTWLDVSAYPVRNARDQTVEEYVTVSREALFDNGSIHELRALEQQVARMTTLFDAVPGMIYQWTQRPDGSREFTFCNQWPQLALGIDPKQLGTLDVKLAELAHPEDSLEAWRLWEQAKNTLEPWTWHGRFLPRPGEVLHVVGHATPVKQADGTVLWSGVLLDDTQRRRMEEALQQSEQLFGTVVANMEMAHLRLDLEGKVLMVNPAAVRMLGFDSADQLLGKSAAKQLWLSPARFAELQGQVLREGVAAVDTPLRRRDGSLRAVQGALRLQRSANEQPVAIDGVLRDVTEERARSDELVHAREAAEAGSRAKSVFLANMSHEIRTPMNAIIGLSHLALDADPEPRQRQYLTQIRAAGVTLLDIINDVLDVSKIEAGKVQLESEPFEIDRVLEAVANVISVRAAERKLEIVFAVDPRVPGELVGDRMRLGQVIMNLASNAVKFTEAGEVVVSVELLAQDAHNARLRFAVRDTGIGMTREQQRRLFEPFSQVDSSSSRKYSGTGLGLAISQELVHMMGGQIEIESAPGRGSEFRFEVTLGIGSSEGRERRKLPIEVGLLRVLVVDESQVAREVLTRGLLAMGFFVCAVPSCDEAFATLQDASQRAKPFQLALIDVRASEAAGLALVERIAKERGLTTKPSVVMMSTQAREDIERAHELSNVRAFLRKPISRSTLLDTIMEVVDGQLTASAPSHPAEAVPAARPERAQPLRGLSLLVVEDNEINQILARDLLEAAGARVVLASDGYEAVRLAAAQTPAFDVIMMDVQMPGMDGHATTRQLRGEEKTAHTPIIAMTAHAFDAERSKCLASGMNAHVAKPINPRELVQTVLSWGRPGARDKSAVSSPTGSAPKASAAHEPSFDATALALVFKDAARQLAFLRKFVDSARQALSELDGYFRSHDHGQIGFIGHKLKSSAKACGAHALSSTFAEIEQHAKLPDWRALDSLRGKADQLLREVVSHVEQREQESRDVQDASS